MTKSAAEAQWTDEGSKPESEQHNQTRNDVQAMLRAHFASRTDVYVSGEIIVAYPAPDRIRHVCPDVFVVIGAHKQARELYAVWREGLAPQFVLEVVSHVTVRDDRGRKLRIYRDTLRVREYFLFDPAYPSSLSPLLQGYRLVNDQYEPIKPQANGRLLSEVLGLEWGMDEARLRSWDAATQTRLLTPTERIVVLEAELARLRALLPEQAS